MALAISQSARCGVTGSFILSLAALSHFFNDFIQSIIPAVYPIFREEFALTFFQIGVISFFLQLVSSVFQPFIGYRTDIRPAPFSIPVGAVMTTVGLVALSQATSFLTILMSVCFIGCGSAIFHPEMSRIAQLAGKGRRGFAQAIFQVGGNAGGALGPAATALIILPLGLKSIGWFSLTGVVIVILTTYISLAYSNHLSTNPHLYTGAKDIKASDFLKNIFSITFLILFLLMFSKQIYTSCLVNFLTFFLMDKFQISIEASQYCLFAVLISGAIGTVIGGIMTDFFGRKRMIIFSIFGAAPFSLLLPWANLTFSVLLTVIIAFIISSAFSAILVCALDLMPKNTGAVSGIFFGLCFGLGGIGSLVLGAIADSYGINTVFQGTAFLPLIGAIAVFLPNDKKAVNIA